MKINQSTLIVVVISVLTEITSLELVHGTALKILLIILTAVQASASHVTGIAQGTNLIPTLLKQFGKGGNSLPIPTFPPQTSTPTGNVIATPPPVNPSP